MVNFKKYANQAGFVRMRDGMEIQINIGEITEIIWVEALGGCHRDALLHTMRKLHKETGKTVKTKFCDEILTIGAK